MSTPQKIEKIAILKEAAENSKAILLSDFTGITANMMASIRGKIAETGGDVEVAKNRLVKIALQGTPGEGLAEFLKGQTIITFCSEDAVGPAKVIKEFTKALPANQSWIIKAALVDGKIFTTSQAQALCDLPSVDEIKANAVGAIAGPLNATVGVLNGALRDFVYTLQAVADKRSE